LIPSTSLRLSYLKIFALYGYISDPTLNLTNSCILKTVKDDHFKNNLGK